MTLVVVQPMEATKWKDSMFEEFISRGSLLKDLPIALMSPDATPALSPPKEPLSDDAEAESPVTSGDQTGQARLFGIYSGQIQARIDRVWRRPRTPVDEQRTQSPGASSWSSSYVTANVTDAVLRALTLQKSLPLAKQAVGVHRP